MVYPRFADLRSTLQHLTEGRLERLWQTMTGRAIPKEDRIVAPDRVLLLQTADWINWMTVLNEAQSHLLLRQFKPVLSKHAKILEAADGDASVKIPVLTLGFTDFCYATWPELHKYWDVQHGGWIAVLPRVPLHYQLLDLNVLFYRGVETWKQIDQARRLQDVNSLRSHDPSAAARAPGECSGRQG